MTVYRLVPKDPRKIIRELDALARVLVGIGDGEYTRIHEAIAHAFFQNFEDESSGGFAWRSLAPRTQAEREALGHDPHHPILVREGDYKESWVNIHHPLHIADHGAFAGTQVIIEGSKDPRVPTLSGGDWVLNVPPRPVEEIDDTGMERILDVIFDIIETEADKVPDRKASGSVSPLSDI